MIVSADDIAAWRDAKSKMKLNSSQILPALKEDIDRIIQVLQLEKVTWPGKYPNGILSILACIQDKHYNTVKGHLNRIRPVCSSRDVIT